MTDVLITGARGKTGAPLAELLAQEDGVRVRGGSSDPSRVDAAGVEPARFSWDDSATWEDAVRGVDAIYLVRPDRADAPELARDLLAVTAGDAHVVLLSELDRGAFDPDDWAPRTERAVREGAARTPEGLSSKDTRMGTYDCNLNYIAP